MARPARVARALLALHHRDPGTAWPLLNADRGCSLRLAPAEFFRAGFQVDPETARATLSAIRHGDERITAGPRIWTDIARTSFVAGAEDLSQWALEQVDLNA